MNFAINNGELGPNQILHQGLSRSDKAEVYIHEMQMDETMVL